MTQGLTISEEELQQKQADGVGLKPELSDEALERMEHNRATEFYHPDMMYLDDAPFAAKSETAHRTVLTASAQIRRLRIDASDSSPSENVEEELAKQIEIVREGARRHFELLEPLLPYHVTWEDADFPTYGVEKFDTIDPEAGLSQVQEVGFDNLSHLEAKAIDQELVSACHAFGIYVDISEDLLDI